MIEKKIKIREKILKNRIVISPMCQYSSKDGAPNDWHYKHYSALASSNAAMLILESTAVNKRGKITHNDLCLSNRSQFSKFKKFVEHLKKINKTIIIGLQISHSGRKGSCQTPWEGSKALRGKSSWKTIAPSLIKRSKHHPMPQQAKITDIKNLINDYKFCAKLADKAGFDAIELHMAHGYLLHQFFSPISNTRKDVYGLKLKGRTKLILEISRQIRNLWPKNKILGARITASDHLNAGIELNDSIYLAKKLESLKFDYLSISSGGIIPKTKLNPNPPAFRSKLSKQLKKHTNLKITTSGNLNDVKQINRLIKNKSIDFATIARPFLRNPNWINENFKKNKLNKFIPKQYVRAFN